MANNIEKLKVLNRLVLFSVWLYDKVDKFDRKRKFTLGERIIHYCDTAQEWMIKANATTDRNEAARLIFDALTCLDMVSIKTRIACDCNSMTVKDKAMADEGLGEINDMARRWRRYFLRKGRSAAGDSPEAESLLE